MSKTLTICASEVKRMLRSPGFYVVSAVFVFAAGTLCVDGLSSTGGTPVQALFGHSAFWALELFLAGAVAWNLISGDLKDGTFELTMTSGVGEWAYVLGKIKAACRMHTFAWLFLLPFAVVAWYWRHFDIGTGVIAFLAAQLVGWVLVSAFAFAGTLFSKPGAGAVLGGVIGTVYISVKPILGQLPLRIPPRLVSRFSVTDHFQRFSTGIIDGGAVGFYLSTLIIFTFLAVLSLRMSREIEMRKL